MQITKEKTEELIEKFGSPLFLLDESLFSESSQSQQAVGISF